MLACHCPLVAVVLAVCACTALSQEISWNYAETPTDNRPRFREDAFLFRLSLNRLALVGGLTGTSGCVNAVDLWTLSVDSASKKFTWASISADTGLNSSLTAYAASPALFKSGYSTSIVVVGGAYGSLARCGILPVMSSDVFLLSIEETASARKVTCTNVATSGTQPMPRAYGSLVLMTNGQLLLWGGGSVTCGGLQGQSPVRCSWKYEATIFTLDPQSWRWSAVQPTAAAAPSPSLYPMAAAGPDNSVLVYGGCLAQPICNNSALSSAAFFGKLSSSSSSSSITWSPIANSASPAPLYGACVASPWPHASFEPEPSYSQSGAAMMTGGITLASAFVPSLPITAFPFDSPAALASIGAGASSARPQPRAFSACSLIGISDYFMMYGGSGRSASGAIEVYEDLWFFPIPPAYQVKQKYQCLKDVPCLVGVSIVLGWASGGVTLSILLLLSSPASYRRSLQGTRVLWVIFGLLGTHRFYLKRPWSGLLFLSTCGLLGIGFVVDGLYLRAIYKLNKQNMRKQQLRPYLDQRFGRYFHEEFTDPLLAAINDYRLTGQVSPAAAAANAGAASSRCSRWLDHLTRLWLGGTIKEIENFESTVATRSTGDALQYRDVPSEASDPAAREGGYQPPSLSPAHAASGAYAPSLPSVTRSDVGRVRHEQDAVAMGAVFGVNRAQFSDTMTI